MERRRRRGQDLFPARVLGAALLAIAALAGSGQAAQAQDAPPAGAEPAGDAPASATNDAIIADIENEADESASEASALALSQSKADSGDLTGAAAVLERYLLIAHDAVEPRARYAVLLCRLDDLEGGRFEGAKIASGTDTGSAVQEVETVCGPVPDIAATIARGE